MRLLIFNPDTDLALANGCEYFEAPKSSKQFTKDLELLSLVYADYEDIILIDNLKSVSHLTDKITSVIPWGWNQALRKKLLKIGVGETVIPTYNDVQTIRDLSHRKSSVYILEKLKSCDSYYYPLPVTPKIITNANVGLDLYTDSPDSLFKTPWSNSGKGIWWKNTGSVDLLSKWLQSSISKFGSVIYEKEYHKLLDYAMIFKINSIGDIDF